MEDTAFTILSGGKNSRLGLNKAFLEINGEPIINRMLQIGRNFPQQMLITNEPEIYQQYEIEIYIDIFPHRGPISGIHSALKHSKFANVFVISCDMPFMTLKTIQLIKSYHNNTDITIPVIHDKSYYVCGLYSTNILDKLDKYLIQGAGLPIDKNRYFALYQLENIFNVNKIHIDKLLIEEKEFININTIDDWNKVKYYL